MNSTLQSIIDRHQSAVREYINFPAQIAKDMTEHLGNKKNALSTKAIGVTDFTTSLRTKAADVANRMKMIADNVQALAKDRFNVVQNTSYAIDDATDFSRGVRNISTDYLSVNILSEKQFDACWAEYVREIQNALGVK